MTLMNLSSFLSIPAGQMPLGMQMSAALAFAGQSAPETFAKLSAVAEGLADAYGKRGKDAFRAAAYENDREAGARAFVRAMEPYFKNALLWASLQRNPVESARNGRLFEVDYGAMLLTGLMSFDDIKIFLGRVKSAEEGVTPDVIEWVLNTARRVDAAAGKTAQDVAFKARQGDGKGAAADKPARAGEFAGRRGVAGAPRGKLAWPAKPAVSRAPVASAAVLPPSDRKARNILRRALASAPAELRDEFLRVFRYMKEKGADPPPDELPGYAEFPALIAVTFRQLREKINSENIGAYDMARFTKTLASLFEFVDVLVKKGFEIPVTKFERYIEAKEKYAAARDREMNPLTTRTGGAKGPECFAHADTAGAPLESARDIIKRIAPRHTSHLRQLMISMYRALEGRRSSREYLITIDDADFPRLIKNTLDELLREIKAPPARGTACARASVTAVKDLFRLIDAALAAGHKLPFLEDEKYSAARERYRGSDVKDAPARSSYKVTVSITPYELYQTNGYVIISNIAGKKLEIRALNFARDVKVDVRLGGEDAGAISFRKQGRGSAEIYTRGSDRGIRIWAGREAVAGAIAECFERGRKRALDQGERFRGVRPRLLGMGGGVPNWPGRGPRRASGGDHPDGAPVVETPDDRAANDPSEEDAGLRTNFGPPAGQPHDGAKIGPSVVMDGRFLNGRLDSVAQVLRNVSQTEITAEEFLCALEIDGLNLRAVKFQPSEDGGSMEVYARYAIEGLQNAAIMKFALLKKAADSGTVRGLDFGVAQKLRGFGYGTKLAARQMELFRRLGYTRYERAVRRQDGAFWSQMGLDFKNAGERARIIGEFAEYVARQGEEFSEMDRLMLANINHPWELIDFRTVQESGSLRSSGRMFLNREDYEWEGVFDLSQESESWRALRAAVARPRDNLPVAVGAAKDFADVKAPEETRREWRDRLFAAAEKSDRSELIAGRLDDNLKEDETPKAERIANALRNELGQMVTLAMDVWGDNNELLPDFSRPFKEARDKADNGYFAGMDDDDIAFAETLRDIVVEARGREIDLLKLGLRKEDRVIAQIERVFAALNGALKFKEIMRAAAGDDIIGGAIMAKMSGEERIFETDPRLLLSRERLTAVLTAALKDAIQTPQPDALLARLAQFVDDLDAIGFYITMDPKLMELYGKAAAGAARPRNHSALMALVAAVYGQVDFELKNAVRKGPPSEKRFAGFVADALSQFYSSLEGFARLGSPNGPDWGRLWLEGGLFEKPEIEERARMFDTVIEESGAVDLYEREFGDGERSRLNRAAAMGLKAALAAKARIAAD